jgi:imidazole glycerol phosphate synthase subunit HisF
VIESFLLHCMSPLLAQSGHGPSALHMSAVDPKTDMEGCLACSKFHFKKFTSEVRW